MKRLLRLGLVCALLYGSGAPWAFLQAAAWAGMTVRGEFDPCAVCHIVEKAASPVQPNAALPQPKAHFAGSHILEQSQDDRTAAGTVLPPLRSAILRCRRPESPPPKFLAV